MKGLAKFFAGFITFLILDLFFVNFCNEFEFPHLISGIYFTKTTNLLLFIIAVLILLFLVFYGWNRKEK